MKQFWIICSGDSPYRWLWLYIVTQNSTLLMHRWNKPLRCVSDRDFLTLFWYVIPETNVSFPDRENGVIFPNPYATSRMVLCPTLTNDNVTRIDGLSTQTWYCISSIKKTCKDMILPAKLLDSKSFGLRVPTIFTGSSWFLCCPSLRHGVSRIQRIAQCASR